MTKTNAEEEGLRKAIIDACSTYSYNEFEPDNPIQHRRINKKMIDIVMKLIAAEKRKADIPDYFIKTVEVDGMPITFEGKEAFDLFKQEVTRRAAEEAERRGEVHQLLVLKRWATLHNRSIEVEDLDHILGSLSQFPAQPLARETLDKLKSNNQEEKE